MVSVGVLFVINSMDSLIRLYSDNLKLTTRRFGKPRYFCLHAGLLVSLTFLFSVNFIRIQWIGATVIGLGFCCMLYIYFSKRQQLAEL